MVTNCTAVQLAHPRDGRLRFHGLWLCMLTLSALVRRPADPALRHLPLFDLASRYFVVSESIFLAAL